MPKPSRSCWPRKPQARAPGAQTPVLGLGGASGAGGDFGSLEGKYGLPGGILGRLRQQESGGNDNAVSAAGAVGPFQFMPGTAAQYGIADSTNLGQASEGAAHYLFDLYTKFGSWRKALAAYNMGPAALDDDIYGNVGKHLLPHGADWLAHAPHETQAFVANLTRGWGADGPAGARAGGTTTIQQNGPVTIKHAGDRRARHRPRISRRQWSPKT